MVSKGDRCQKVRGEQKGRGRRVESGRRQKVRCRGLVSESQGRAQRAGGGRSWRKEIAKKGRFKKYVRVESSGEQN